MTAPALRAKRAVRRLLASRRAATAVEYGLILALVVLTLMAALHEVAGTTVTMWGNVNNRVTSAHGGA